MEANHIQVSDAARRRLAGLLASEDAFIRLAVTAGGCSGLLYRLTVDQLARRDDVTLFLEEPVKVVSDPYSAQYLPGLRIDYSDDLIAAGFRFDNPNAAAACGCGASFAAGGAA
jgi:iron-sulfur cluster assembly protein